MAAVYFDTSALLRRYDDTEPGADRVQVLCRRSSGHLLLIAAVASIEVASALNRKFRERSLSRAERDRSWRLFRSHRRDRYIVAGIDERSISRAERLLFSHPLKASDALQVATALQAARWLTDITRDFRFCTADRTQATAAEREGLTVEFIA